MNVRYTEHLYRFNQRTLRCKTCHFTESHGYPDHHLGRPGIVNSKFIIGFRENFQKFLENSENFLSRQDEKFEFLFQRFNFGFHFGNCCSVSCNGFFIFSCIIGKVVTSSNCIVKCWLCCNFIGFKLSLFSSRGIICSFSV